MLKLLDVNDFAKGLKAVTSTEYFTRTVGEWHPEGLFSEIIFGPVGSKERREKYSYIHLNSKVIHPTAYKLLIQLNRKLEQFLSSEITCILSEKGELVEDPNGTSGISAFIKMFPDMKIRGESPTRDKVIRVLKKAYDDNLLFIDKTPVIPPAFRDATEGDDGKWMFDPLNDKYLTIIRQAFQVRTTKSGPLFDLLNFGLQKAVNDHDAFIKAKIGKKFGVIRANLLGKRVDFSGRAVITSGPTLKVNEIGVPLRLAVSLFEPFIIYYILYSGRVDKERLTNAFDSYLNLDVSVDSVKKVMKAVKSVDTIPEDLYNLIYEAAEISMAGRVVLAKRDPVLHGESVRAFFPILTKGNTIEMSSLQVGGFNADFDGDQMALFHPITKEAQEEAKEKMMRPLTGKTFESMNFEISKEMATGLYLISKAEPSTEKAFTTVDKDQIEKAINPFEPVNFKGKNTSMGRAVLNYCFPKDYKFVDRVITRKIANALVRDILKEYGDDAAKEVATRLKTQGFKWATLFGPSITLDMLDIPKEIYDLKKKLDGATTEQAVLILEKMKRILVAHLEDTGLYDFVDSGAGKGWDQPMQILAAKGIIADPKGNILPVIKSSFAEGLKPVEFFNASSGARKGIIDRVINTADTGYISRQLIMLLNPVELHPNLKDCGTTKYLGLKLDSGSEAIRRLSGRVVYDRGLRPFVAEDHKVGDVIKLRSPIFCKSLKVCHTCYGSLVMKHRSPFIGVLAALNIGERGTQLIMRTFHTGGAAKIQKKDIIQDIVDNNQNVDVSTVSKYLKQDQNNLICKKGCKVNLNLDFYTLDEDLVIEDNSVWVKSLVSTFTFEDGFSFDVILDYKVTFLLDVLEKTPDNVILTYKPNEVVFESPAESVEIKQQVLYIQRLISGREIYKDIDHLFSKVLKVYSPPVADIDIVHIEVLLSQCLRDADHPEYPARMALNKNRWNPVLANIKRNVFNTGFLQGLAFENVGEAIKTGLITDSKVEPSIIEKVMTGELVEKKED